MITYCASYYWLIRIRYFAAYTVSPSPWTYPSSGCCSLAVVAVYLKLCCSLCCSPEYLQNAFFVLICKSRRRISCNMPYALIRLAALSWRDRPDFALALLSTGSFAPIVKWNTRPHGLFALPAAVHVWERTCHLKHCNYVIFTSNTDEIVKKYCSYMSLSLPANIPLRERERERLSLSAFLRTEDIGVHIVHISRLIITYILE